MRAEDALFSEFVSRFIGHNECLSKASLQARTRQLFFCAKCVSLFAVWQENVIFYSWQDPAYWHRKSGKMTAIFFLCAFANAELCVFHSVGFSGESSTREFGRVGALSEFTQFQREVPETNKEQKIVKW